MPECVGRDREKAIFQKALQSKSAELIAVIGRRRVGKTFLIRSFFESYIQFEITGIHDGTLSEQLQNFSYQLTRATASEIPLASPKNWIAAFQQLTTYLESKKSKQKHVVFIDELPWIASSRSGFMKALENFWNSWAVKQKIVIILCGSAATWMTKKLVHNKGGLHNRITRQIHLTPFDLDETRRYLKSQKVSLDAYQTIQLYMVTGGIPYYLKEVQNGQSSAQNIDRICFEPQGFLRDEFQKLYASLFDNPENHIAIIRALSQNKLGLTRQQIVSATKMKDGGSVTRLLDELESSGFITSYQPFANTKKNSLFRLTDEYSLFYLKFIEKKKAGGQGTWLQLSQSQSYKSWAGYAFENLCLKHIAQIKKAIGIERIYTESSSYYFSGNEDQSGFQIDLLIDRKDGIINICELKFYSAPYTITKSVALELRARIEGFRSTSKTKKQISLIFVSTFGIVENSNSIGLVDQNIEMEALFLPTK